MVFIESQLAFAAVAFDIISDAAAASVVASTSFNSFDGDEIDAGGAISAVIAAVDG